MRYIKPLSEASYEAYKRGLARKREVLNRHGTNLYADVVLTWKQFQQTYEATRKMLLEDVKAGRRKAVGNVTQYMISRQAYRFTAGQARAIRENKIAVTEEIDENGKTKKITPKMMDIRTESENVKMDWSFVKFQRKWWEDHPEEFADLTGRINFAGHTFTNSRGGTGVETIADFNDYISWYLFDSEA